MNFPAVLTQHLDSLTEGLDGTGDDLLSILQVLADDLTAAIPSFLGLHVTATAPGGGDPITVTTMDEQQTAQVRASLRLPLAACPAGTVIYYAAAPGAFDAMAVEIQRAHQFDGQVQLDLNLHPTNRPGITGLAELTAINQAVGILIGRGRTLQQAHAELRSRAHARRHTDYETATQLIRHLTPGHPQSA